MSLPGEKANAILNAREFLYRLMWRPCIGGYAKIPLQVRRTARAILKHFPYDYELAEALTKNNKYIDQKVFEQKFKKTQKLYKEWKSIKVRKTKR